MPLVHLMEQRRGGITDELFAAWQAYIRYRRKRATGEIPPRLTNDLTERYAGMVCTKLAHLTDAQAAESLRRSVENGWIGVFALYEPPKHRRTAPMPLDAQDLATWRP